MIENNVVLTEDSDNIESLVVEMPQGKQVDSSLESLFKSCLDAFRSVSITGKDAYDNLYLLIFIRLLKKLIKSGVIDFTDMKEYDIPPNKRVLDSHKKHLDFELDDIETKDILAVLKQLWFNVLSKHKTTKDIFVSTKFFGVGKSSNEKSVAEVFKTVIKKLKDFPFEEYDSDILGDSYQYIAHEMNSSTDNNMGQFFTPPRLMKIVIQKVDPKLYEDGTFEDICDPACGSGGFLKEALKYIKSKAQDKGVELDYAYAANEGITGIDADGDIFKIAMSNMIISLNKPPKKLDWKDTLRDVIESGRTSVIVANPPFGIKGIDWHNLDGDIYPIKTADAPLLFIQRFIDMLKIGGRAGIVLPDGKQMFGGGENATVRELLIRTCKVTEIMEVPKETFEKTSIATCVLFFEKVHDVEQLLEVIEKGKKRNYKFKNDMCATSKVKFTIYQGNCIKSKGKIKIKRIKEKNWSLNFKTYQETKIESEYDIKTLGELCEFLPTTKHTSSIGQNNGQYRFYNSSQTDLLFLNTFEINKESIIIGNGGNLCVHYDTKFTASKHVTVCHVRNDTVLCKYIYYYLLNHKQFLVAKSDGCTISWLNKTNLASIKIPVPPIERQQKIVNILDKCYYEINKFKESIDNIYLIRNDYVKQKTYVCDKVTLGDILQFVPKKMKYKAGDGKPEGNYRLYTSSQDKTVYVNTCEFKEYCLIMGRNGLPSVHYDKNFSVTYDHVYVLNTTSKNINLKYVYYYLHSFKEMLNNIFLGMGIEGTSQNAILGIKIHIPSLQVQNNIVQVCEQFDNNIKNNQTMIEMYESIIKEYLN